jgi:2-methylcitrate dehydratase PrpD
MENDAVTARLARFAADLRFEDLTPEIRHQGTRLIYDTLICAVAGSATKGTKLLSSVMLESGGRKQATLLPGGRRTGTPVAAFLNAMSANDLDLDDNLLYHSRMGNTIICAALAVAEQVDASGQDLVTAVVAGYETAARVTLSMPGFMKIEESESGPSMVTPNPYSFSFNTIGAAVAAGHLLKLNATRMAHNIGLAAYSAPTSSVGKAVSKGSFTQIKPGMFGWQAWSGCIAAMMAAKGVDGDDTALDGPAGFWKMIGATSVDWDIMTRELGTRWWIQEISFKLEPAGTWMRPALRAMRTVIEENKLQPEEIHKIDVYLHAPSQKLFSKSKPTRYLDAQVSYPYLLSVTALGIPMERWQDPKVFRSKALRNMIARVEMHPDEEAREDLLRELSVPPRRATGALTKVRVHARGREFLARSRYGAGDPGDPSTRATDTDLDKKFERFAAPLLADHAALALRSVWGLETGTSTRELVGAFCRPRRKPMSKNNE